MSPRNSAEIGQRRHYNWRGEQFPSVTTILKLGTPKEWLGAWAAKMVGELAVTEYEELGRRIAADPVEATRWLKGAPWRQRDQAADFGSAVHEVGEAIARELPFTVSDELRPHTRELWAWHAAYRVRPVYAEQQVFSLQQRYAGTFDLIADCRSASWEGTRRLLIDYKTSKQLDHTMRLQLAAYRHADVIGADDLVIDEMPVVDGCAVLWIPRDRPEQWQFVEVAAGMPEYRAFLAAKTIHDFTVEHEKRAVGELILPQAQEGVA